MIITWDQIIALSPILIIGITVVIIMLSIAYRRDQFKHALLSIIGLSLALFSACNIIWENQGSQNIFKMICIDNTSVLYMILIILSSVASSISIYKWLLHHSTNNGDEFYLLLLISCMGGILLTTTNHLIILFLGIELVTIPLFSLISYSVFQKHSIESSVKYILLSGISSSFLLFGIAFVYAATGHLSFIDIKDILVAQNNINTIPMQFMLLIIMGLGMMMIGFSFKLSFVPFHLWTPDVYQGAPSAVSMYLSTGSKIAITSALMRFLLILPDQYKKVFYIFLSGSACCSMLFGSLMAMQQNNIKRIFAYSSVTHAGYLLIGLIALKNNPNIVHEAIGIYLISYLLSNIGAFGIINIISIINTEKYSDTLSIYRGLFWREPVLSIIFVIIILSLAGIPITVGFIGKFYILLIAIYHQLWWMVVFMIISSIISIFYYLKIIINLFLDTTKNPDCNYEQRSSNWISTPLGILSGIIAIMILILGLYPQPMIQFLHLICI